MIAFLGKLLLSFGFDKLAAWLGVKREVKAARAKGKVEGRAEAHGEAFAAKVKELRDAPPVITADEANRKDAERRKGGMW